MSTIGYLSVRYVNHDFVHEQYAQLVRIATSSDPRHTSYTPTPRRLRPPAFITHNYAHVRQYCVVTGLVTVLSLY